MFMTTSIASNYGLVFSLENRGLTRRPRVLAAQKGIDFQGKQRFSIFSTTQRGLRNLAVYASVTPAPGPPIPPDPPSNSWRNWILGLVVTLILPFFTHKWGPLQKILNWFNQIDRTDSVVATAEEVVDVIEAVAEKVDKVAEDISDDLPEGGKLRKAADLIEDVAERIAKDAHVAGNLIDKVEEVEEKVESLIEAVDDHQATKAAKIERANSNSQEADKN